MSILIDEDTPCIVQGFTGQTASFHAREMLAYGTRLVGGVTPGKGDRMHPELNKPVFNTVREAVEETGAEASIVFVPPPFAADAIMEAAEAGIRYCVSITDGIPAQDMMRVKRYLRSHDDTMRLTGPNCAGTISPGRALLGIMPPHIYMPGSVGIVARSGTLGYEAASQMKSLGIGVSTSVGIGGDPINGSSFRGILEQFEADPETRAVLLIGEIGGPQEAEAAAYIRDHMSKPVAAYIAGLSAPKGRRMGHAGAIVRSSGETAAEKTELLRAAGVHIVPNPSEFGSTLQGIVDD
ncbi:MAG: succinate--CoA ligase subunit alpha [Arenicellales bacterium]